ncbi:MAG: TolC family protein, partial [Fluviicola sp.]
STSFNTSFGRRLDPFTNTFATSNVNSQSFGLNASMNVFNGFSYFYKRNVLNTSILLSQLDVKKSENEQIRSLIESYVNVCKAQLRLSISDKKIKNIQETQTLQRVLFKAGRINSIDTLKSYISIKNEEISQSKIHAEKRLLEIDMNFKMGLPLSSEHGYKIESISTIADKLLLAEYFESERLKLELQNEVDNLKIAKTALMPSVSLNGNIGTGFSTNNKDFTTPGNPTKPYDDQINQNLYEAIGIYVNIPLFSKGEYLKQKELTNLKKDQLQETQKKIETDQAKRMVEIEQRILSLSAEITLENEVLKTLQQVFEKTQLLYKEGRIQYTELETNRLLLFDKEMAIEQLKVELLFLKLQNEK